MKSIAKELKLIYKKYSKEPDIESDNILPIEMDRFDCDINKIMDQYLLLTKKQKKRVRISENVGWFLVAFGDSMAAYSLRLGEQKYFTNGLVALGMAFEITDLRDVLRILALYWDVHSKKQLSFQPVIDQDDEFSKVIQQFIERDESNKSLKCMCYEVIGEGENVQYRSNW